VDAEALYDACRSASERERAAGFEALGRLLYRLLWPRVKGDPLGAERAADCVQEALEVIWRRLEAGAGPEVRASFVSWSARIAVNRLLDEVRRLEPTARVRRTKRIAASRLVSLDAPTAGDGPPLVEQLADPHADAPEDPRAYDEIAGLVELIRAMPAVSEPSRTVLLFGFLAGWSDDELAARLGTTRPNVHVIRCRDLAKVRQDPEFMARLAALYGEAPA